MAAKVTASRGQHQCLVALRDALGEVLSPIGMQCTACGASTVTFRSPEAELNAYVDNGCSEIDIGVVSSHLPDAGFGLADLCAGAGAERVPGVVQFGGGTSCERAAQLLAGYVRQHCLPFLAGDPEVVTRTANIAAATSAAITAKYSARAGMPLADAARAARDFPAVVRAYAAAGSALSARDTRRLRYARRRLERGQG